MILLDVLAIGVRGAESGTAEIYRRGTTTFATLYADYDASVTVTPTAGVALDSNGGAEWYVNEAVDIVIKNSSGTTVRTFTAMAGATNTEVRSQSFTGTDYSTALSAVSYPAMLSAILDLWRTNAGNTSAAIDWKVVIGGVAKTLSTAFSEVSGVYYNVKATTYGAKGDGTTDDTSAIQAAIDAADAAGGGVVFFPAGSYRTTAVLTLKSDVSLLGAGAQASAILIDHATANAISVAASGSGEPQFIRDLEVMPLQSNSGKMVSVESGSVLTIDNCTIGQSLLTGQCVAYDNVSTFLNIKNCRLICNGSAAYHVRGPTAGSVNIIGCRLTWSATNMTTASIYARGTACNIIGTIIDLSAITNAAANGIVLSLGNVGTASVIGSQILGAAVATSITSLDQNSPWFFEHGLTVGVNILHANPSISLSGAPAAHEGAWHSARQTRYDFVTDNGASISIPCHKVGMYEVRRTNNGAQTITFQTPLSAAQHFILTWNNDHAAGGGVITLAGNVKGLANFTVNANSVSHYHFKAVQNAAAGAASSAIYWVLFGSTVNVTP